MTAADIISNARANPYLLGPSLSRHSNPLVRILDAKRERKLWSDILDGLGREPSHERDVAYDEYVSASDTWRREVQTAWDHRAVERMRGEAA